jgi:hypothetical protein
MAAMLPTSADERGDLAAGDNTPATEPLMGAATKSSINSISMFKKREKRPWRWNMKEIPTHEA